MRVFVPTILVACLLALGLLWASRDGERAPEVGSDPASRSPGPEEARPALSEALALPPTPTPNAPRLAGAATEPGGEPAEAKPPPPPFLPPPLFSAQERVAQMLIAGTRTERLWAEYVASECPPVWRRWIDDARTRLEASPSESPWATPPTSLDARIALHFRLLRASPGLWRDIGVDMRGDQAHVYLDDTEVELLDLVHARHPDRLSLEDEHRVQAQAGVIDDYFLRATAPWPKLPAGPTLPLGAAIRILPVAQADARFLTLQIRLCMAVPAGEGRAGEQVAVRTGGTGTFVMPDGGTVLFLAHESVWVPSASPGAGSDEADDPTRYLVMLHAARE